MVVTVGMPDGFSEATLVTRRTGVIVGINRDRDLAADEAEQIRRLLDTRFPGVTFAVVSGAKSVAFEFDEEVE